MILELKNIGKRYRNDIIFENINLKVKKGEVISIIGQSGCGKSTLLKCINKVEIISEGKIFLNGNDIDDMELVELRKNIGIVFQEYNLFDHLNVLDNLTIGLIKVKKQNPVVSKKQAIDILKRIGLEDKWDKYPDELSGGQRQRVAIARTLLMKPKVILLDEPTSALDKDMKEEVFNLIQDMVRQKVTLLIVSHEEEFVYKVSDKIYSFKNKNLVEVK